MIRRSRLLAALDAGLQLSPVTAILGPRQCGKTTLALEIARQHRATYFDLETLQSHPKLGASWEGFAMEQILALTGERNAYFWATQSRAELDLLIFARGKRWGFEFKYQDAPEMTRSLHLSLADLNPERVWIVYPGNNTYPVHDRVEVVPLSKALAQAQSLL